MPKFRNYPLGIWLLWSWFALAPVLELVAFFTHTQFWAFGLSWKSALVYLVITPVTGYFIWTRHARARFAAYLFLTLEIYRSAFKYHQYWLLALNLAILIYLQLPEARAVFPSVRAVDVITRLKGIIARLKSRFRHPGGNPPSPPPAK